jgi:cell division inhibitor SulA
MPQYVIEREVPNAGRMSEDELRAAAVTSLEALGELGPRIRWLHSYVSDNKIYCVFLAPDEETIREHARRAGLPVNRVSAVRRLLDPVNYQ